MILGATNYKRDFVRRIKDVTLGKGDFGVRHEDYLHKSETHSVGKRVGLLPPRLPKVNCNQ